MDSCEERPLKGIRVVDQAEDRGELCGRLLADLGGEVIRVEPPGGSRSRKLPPFHDGTSLYFAVRNLGENWSVKESKRALGDAGERGAQKLEAGANAAALDDQHCVLAHGPRLPRCVLTRTRASAPLPIDNSFRPFSLSKRHQNSGLRPRSR